MENPEHDLPRVISLLASSKAPTILHKVVERFYTPDASLRHPFSVVKSGPNSRQTLLGVYEWHRIISPGTTVTINELVYDREKNVAYLDVSQTSQFRFVPFPIRPSRLITRLKLVERDNQFYIIEQEVFFHPEELMKSIFPPLVPLVTFFLELVALAALLRSKVCLGLNEVWLALFRGSRTGETPSLSGDNQGSGAHRNAQYGQY